MNIELGDLFERTSLLFVILGTLLLVIAALGGLPLGTQPTPAMEAVWRYVLAGIGLVLLAIGVGLVFREDGGERETTKAAHLDTITTFDSDREASQYVLRRLREAKTSVSDLTYEDFTGPGKTILFFDSDDRDAYLHIVEEISKRVKYREIIMLRGKRHRVAKARRLIAHAGKYYQLAGYADIPDNAPPRHNFLIIDDEEVIVKRLAMREPNVVAYFRSFYEELWRAAEPIRVSTVTDFGLIEEAERRFAPLEPED
jgi:hypothetical protein